MQVTPLWLLGHLTGLFPQEAESVLAAVFTSIFAVFAVRKYSQAIKDDIGDKSVFTCALLTCAAQLLRSLSCCMSAALTLQCGHLALGKASSAPPRQLSGLLQRHMPLV